MQTAKILRGGAQLRGVAQVKVVMYGKMPLSLMSTTQMILVTSFIGQLKKTTVLCVQILEIQTKGATCSNSS